MRKNIHFEVNFYNEKKIVDIQEIWATSPRIALKWAVYWMPKDKEFDVARVFYV